MFGYLKQIQVMMFKLYYNNWRECASLCTTAAVRARRSMVGILGCSNYGFEMARSEHYGVGIGAVHSQNRLCARALHTSADTRDRERERTRERKRERENERAPL